MVIDKASVIEIVTAIWQNILDLPIAECPKPSSSDKPRCVVACVHISGPTDFAVTFQCTARFASIAASRFFDLPVEAVSSADSNDAVGELTNMVGGNIKGLLPGPSRLSLPTIAEGIDFEVRVPNTAVVQELWFDSRGESIAVRVLGRVEA